MKKGMISIKKYFVLFLGLSLLAYSVQSVLRPNNLMTGGITGITRILEVLISNNFKMSTFLQENIFNLIYYFFSLIIVLLAYIFLGKVDTIKIIFLSFVYPLVLFLFTYLKVPPLIISIPIINNGSNGYFNDLLLPSITYGALSGIGTGLILRSGYTTGGSDTIAKIINKRIIPFVSIGQILLIFDGIVIFSSLTTFSITIVIYALINKYVNAKAIDMIVLGIGNKRVKMEIITNKFNDVANFILTKINRGVTFVEAEGAFSHIKTKQLITICTPKESLQIKDFIATIDHDAFVYVIPSQTVWGRGFKDILKDD